MNLGTAPQPLAPWRTMIFRVHCIVTQRWMKIRVPFGWYWYGSSEWGTPEVESGTIAASNPQPPPQALARRIAQLPMTNDGGELPEAELEAYRTPTHEERLAAEEAARPRTVEEDVAAMKEEMRQLRAAAMQQTMGDDAARGGR